VDVPSTGDARDVVDTSAIRVGDGRVLAKSSAASALHCDGLELASKAPQSAPGFKAASWPNQDVGAPAAGNPGAAAPDRGNGVAAADCNLLLLPCPDTRLDAHGGGSET
jgi:hypothetical protein